MKRPSAKAMQAMKAMKAKAPMRTKKAVKAKAPMKAPAKKAVKGTKAPIKAKKPAAVKAKAMKAPTKKAMKAMQAPMKAKKPAAVKAKAMKAQDGRPLDPLAKQLCGLRPHFLDWDHDQEMHYEVNQVIDGELVCQQSVGCHSYSLCGMLRQLQDDGLTRPRIAVFFDSAPTLESSADDRTPYDPYEDSQRDSGR